MGPKEAGIDYYLTPLIHHIEVDNVQILRSEFMSFVQDKYKILSRALGRIILMTGLSSLKEVKILRVIFDCLKLKTN